MKWEGGRKGEEGEAEEMESKNRRMLDAGVIRGKGDGREEKEEKVQLERRERRLGEEKQHYCHATRLR